MKKNNETKVVCPICGAEFAIPEHEHMTAGMAIGKDSGLGVIHPELAQAGNGGTQFMVSGKSGKRSKADERLEALKNAGVDVSNLFAMQGVSGDGMIARMTNGVISVISDDDPIFRAIKNGGTIPERRLFRRWVMAQMFHMLSDKSYTGKPYGYTQALHNKGYEYQWKMIVEELRVQVRLYKNSDMENFLGRNRWFNQVVAVSLAQDYMNKLVTYVDALKVKHCKGVPYKTVCGTNYFVSDLESKLYRPLYTRLSRIASAGNPVELYEAVKAFNDLRIGLDWKTPQSPAWVDAFKGSGAYYTLKNLVMFHGARISNYGKEKSLVILETMAEQYKNEGWRLLALMKKTIADNHIDIEKKIAEWRNR